MGFIFDALSVLFFPGMVFIFLGGILSTWAVRWLGALARHEPFSLPAAVNDTFELVERALQPFVAEVRWTGTLPFLTFGAVALASTCLWRGTLWPQMAVLDDLPLFVGCLALPALLAVVRSDWLARNKGLGQGRDVLTLAYSLVVVAAFAVPAVKARSVWLQDIAAMQNTGGVTAFSFSGLLAFVAAFFAVRAQLSLLGTLWQECVALALGPAEALGLQLTRAAWLFVIVSALVLFFWGGPEPGLLAFILFWPKYAVVLALLVAAREVVRARRAEEALELGWLPLAGLAGAALALAMGGL